ncbi:class I SAM-dependent methyltransferase [Candidatus Woesebacteria bacterium]|nr:class I SAM-dependent methyltransferase [Candidatus Woesebacteria bacterium]
MKTTSFDKFAEAYDKEMGGAGSYTKTKTIDPALIEASGTIKDKTIYDIACGNGHLARKMVQLSAKEVWASDISSILIKIAKSRYPSKGIKYLVREGLNFKDIPVNYFELITINMAINYISNLDFFFKGLHRLLKTDGRFAFTSDHPLRGLGLYDLKHDRTITDVINKAKRYHEEYTQMTNNLWPGKNDLYTYRRPLSLYSKLLTKNRFYINAIVEPKTCTTTKTAGGEKVFTTIPIIFAMGAVKSD